MAPCLAHSILVGFLVASVAGYRDGGGTFDPPSLERAETASLELHSGGTMAKPKHRSGDLAREGSAGTLSSLLETGSNRSNHQTHSKRQPLGDGGTEQGLKDEDCTVELVPHQRLMEFREQLKKYLESMVGEFVNKVEKQKEEHTAEATRIESEMTAKVKKTKTELVRMIRGFTIEQQRLMLITRHDISGMCCCKKELDKNKNGKLDVAEIKEVLNSQPTGGVCEWIPKGCEVPGKKLQGLRGNLCPDDLRWPYKDIIGSGARVSAMEVDRIVDDCIDSQEWRTFVEGKKPFKALNDANQGNKGS